MPDPAWVCPYCQHAATLTGSNMSSHLHSFENNNKFGPLGVHVSITVCPNPACREVQLTAVLGKTVKTGRIEGPSAYIKEQLRYWKLLPPSSARPFPTYIPAPILEDYQEACLIQNLSPKASATLSRRCLQGMIRDFWGITKARLIDEIGELQGKVDATTWQAIDAVRRIGNVGAHMEKDISLIVDVEPEEAGLLIGLLEFLLEEWYVHRHERQRHMQQIVAAATAKANQKTASSAPPPPAAAQP